jgi:hypothetical protein
VSEARKPRCGGAFACDQSNPARYWSIRCRERESRSCGASTTTGVAATSAPLSSSSIPRDARTRPGVPR